MGGGNGKNRAAYAVVHAVSENHFKLGTWAVTEFF